MKNVLVLGTGLVSPPLIRFLLGLENVFVTAADVDPERARPLLEHHPRGRLQKLDVRDRRRLDELVADSNLVISLLPPPLHPVVAEHCLDHRVHLITTSYVGDAMRRLHERALQRNVLLLNEIGLDPGLDHMSAVRIIDEARRRGGHVVAFTSFCGGLPAPEASDNPFGYKFSWNPRGVLTAMRNTARYLFDGGTVTIPPDDLVKHCRAEVIDDTIYEVYPNRDSLIYQELYGLSDAHTLIRGTLRRPGWCATIAALAALGLLSEEQVPPADSWHALLAVLAGKAGGSFTAQEAAARLGLPPEDPVIQRLEWLGLFSNAPLPAAATLLELLTRQMQNRMSYQDGERDMVILQHRFEIDYGERREVLQSRLVLCGEPHGDSAMAKTVALPAAFAAMLLLDGRIRSRGVCIPVSAEFYEPILPLLAERGIVFAESRRPLHP